MNIKKAFILKIFALIALGSACNSSTTVNNNSTKAPSNTANSAQTQTDTANGAAPETADKSPDNTPNASLATPTEAYKTAYAARRKKDVALLKRAMSKDALEFFEVITEPGKTIDDTLLKLTETPQAATDESRNEKISGDKATLEYPDANGKWKMMDFIKEGGDWKLTFPMPDSPKGKK